MSESQSMTQLSSLSKEDLKNLAKQAQKAKRDEQAKTAKISPQMCTAMPTSVSFDAPTKVHDLDADQKKLQVVLGKYDVVYANVIMQNKYELMGVERQPQTPLPSQNFDRLLHRLPGNGSLQPRNLCPDRPDIGHSGNSVSKVLDRTKSNSSASLTHIDGKSAKSTPASLHTGSALRTESSINTYSEHNQELSSVIPKPVTPAVNQITTKPDLGNVFVKREPTPFSNRHSSISTREPVLHSIKKEMEQCKSFDNMHVSCPPLPLVLNSGNKELKLVLQEKEDNGNCAAANGVRWKNKPRLQMCENVEDLLQELSHHPMPLTGIQTPLADVKIPFQGYNNVEQKGKEKESPRKQVLVVEEIQEKDPTSDEDSDDDSDTSGSDDFEEGDELRSSVPMRVETETIEKFPHPVATGMKEPVRAAEKTQRMESCSSNESSSSDSDSSDSGSVSDSDDNNEPAEPQKHAKLSSDFLDTQPSPSRQKWGLKSFLEMTTLKMNGQNVKPPSCEAPASDLDRSDDETDVRRSADRISDANTPSNEHDGHSKVMSADEFSPPVPEKQALLSPLKSPPNVKSPTVHHQMLQKTKLKVDDAHNVDATAHLCNTQDLYKKRDKKYFGSQETEVAKAKAHRESKLNSVSTASYESSDSESGSDVDVANASLEVTVNSPKNCMTLNSKKSPKFIDDCSLAPAKIFSAKPENSKLEKLSKEKSESLKSEPDLVLRTNTNFCDSRPNKVDSLKQMIGFLSMEKPVSPIYDAHIDNKLKIGQCPQTSTHEAHAVPQVKPLPLNRNISATIPQTVPVQIALSYLGRVLCIDRQSSEFLKHSIKSRKMTDSLTSSKNSLLTARNSQMDTLARTSNTVKQSANSLIYNGVNEKQTINNVVLDANEGDLNLKSPFGVAMQLKCQLEHPMEESNNDELYSKKSSKRENLKLESVPISHKAVPDSLSHSDSFKKKHKLEAYHEDAKRRKTSIESQPTNASADTAKVESVMVPILDRKAGENERRNSTSSQLSTHSQHSFHSQHGSLPSKNKHVNECKVSQSPHSQTAVSEASANQLVQPVGMDADKLNGTLESCDVVSNTKVCPGKSVGETPEEDRWLLRPDDCHRQAKKYKHQADSMEPCLRKYMLYLEAALCFLQCGYAIEKSQNKKINEAFNMYQDTNKFVMHQYQQLRPFQNSDNKDNVHLKLKVLCLRIQSLVYMKLYLLKADETMKLDRVLEEHYQKRVNVSLQPNMPSPHQTNWNKSTGTPSPMSPLPSPANSVCSVGSVSGDQTPSKISAGPGGQGQLGVPHGSVVIPQRINSIAQKYHTNTRYLTQAHKLWFQADSATTQDIIEFFHEIDNVNGALTITSDLGYMVKYVRTAIGNLYGKDTHWPLAKDASCLVVAD